MAIMRSSVLGSVCAAALACRFDTGGVGSGGDLEQTTGSSSADSMAPTNGAADNADVDAGSNPETNGEGPTGGTDPTSVGSLDDSTGSGGCDDWWNAQWTRRRPVIIGERGLDEALLDVPALVLLNDTRIDYAVMQATGTDLRFVVEGGQELPHEIELWDAAGSSFVWLRLPMIQAMDQQQQRVFMYYGNPAAPAGQAGANVWDPGFVSVHHLSELADSTANAHHGASATPPGVVVGWIGNGRGFDGVDDHLMLTGESAYDFTDALTVEAWIHVDQFAVPYEALVTKGDDAWRLHRSASTRSVGFGTNSMSVAEENLGGMIIVDDDNWHYVVVVYDGTEKRIYVDGMPDGTLAYPDPLDVTDSAVMFGANEQQSGRELEGDMDEVRISNVARTRAWIGVQNRSMSDKLLDYGDEQTCP